MEKKEREFPKYGDVYWVNLDPTVGTEIQKTRPCVIVSNDIQNEVFNRVVIIPLTSSIEKIFSFETLVLVKGKKSKASTNQIRAIDKSRLGKYICSLTFPEVESLKKALRIVLDL